MKSIWLDLPFERVQEYRLVHALAETRYRVCVPVRARASIPILKTEFGIDVDIGICEGRPLQDVEIDHEAPWTQIGQVGRPLIFAHGAFRWCRKRWSLKRQNTIGFAGFVTQERRLTIGKWIEERVGRSPGVLQTRGGRIGDILRRAGRKWLGLDTKTWSETVGDVTSWSSERGRQLDWKAWDPQYFDFMTDCAFVLCPNGTYPWSYRFFEAAMCGSIPIVEEKNAVYDGFVFETMKDPTREFEYNHAIAEHNFQLAVDRITIPKRELEAELKGMSGG